MACSCVSETVVVALTASRPVWMTGTSRLFQCVSASSDGHGVRAGLTPFSQFR